MNLYLIFKSLWRHKGLMFLSILVGIWLALSAAEKSHTTYEGNISLMLDTPGGALVKVGLESGEAAALGRTMQLTNTYAYMVTSRPVLSKLDQKLGPIREQISAVANDKAPIIEVTVVGDAPRRIRQLAKGVANSFAAYINDIQEINNVASKDRIIITLGEPSRVIQLKSRKLETVSLMFLAPLAFFAFISFILDNFKQMRKEEKERKKLTAVQSKHSPQTDSKQIKETVNEAKA